MLTRPLLFAPAVLLLIAPFALGQDPKTPPAPDHGFVLAAALDVALGKLKDTTDLSKTTNYVFRGRVIALNPERTVSLCFDTEHMRVAGAWVGQPVFYAANKDMGPSLDGRMICTTRPGPGWARDGKWDDPRPGKEGPLPRDWTHYRGFYRHKDRVVLSYTIGDCSVLESPGCIQRGKMTIITRSFTLGPSEQSHTLLVAEQPGAKGSLQLAGMADLNMGSEWWLAGTSLGTWEVDGSKLRLKLPALPKGANFKVAIARSSAGDDVAACLPEVHAAREGDAPDLTPLTRGGPARWKDEIVTDAKLGAKATGPYVVDEIGLPEKNPWKGSIRFGGLDFFPDGRAALCTWDGDVWIVSGLDDKLDKVSWKRFAAGLHQPLGLKIINGIIHTAGRDQITRLHDLNDDGEADFHENFNNDAGLTLQRHEFVMDLQTDAAGNLYYCRSGHYVASSQGANCVVYKLPPDGKKLEVVARGFREPNGLSIGPDGSMTVADNEGNGVPQTPIYRLKPGTSYGFTLPKKELGQKEGTWKYLQPPIVWLPNKIDTSAGGQLWIPEGKWGPLGGQLLHTSYGNSALFTVLLDRRGEPWQGAVWKFPLTFSSGIMRGRFHPKDGQLYLCGLRGWGTNAARDGTFCRVRYTGDKLPVPVGFHTTKDGIELTFSAPLDRKSAEDEQNWAGDWSNSIPLPGTTVSKVKEDLPIEKIALSADGQKVTLSLEQRRPVSNFTLQYRLRAATGAPVTGALHGTIHRFP